MCIFNYKVDSVKGTKIFVSPTHDGRQFTVYQNFVSESKGSEKKQNAMILPFPQGDVDLIDLSDYKGFFEDCARCFPGVKEKDEQKSSRKHWNHLVVQSVGGYKVSVAETLADVDRANPKYFKLSGDVSKVLGKHYSTGFSFLICCFKDSGGEMHPLGYIHNLQDAGEEGRTMFIPTRHMHGEEEEEVVDDWDHKIYVVNSNSSTKEQNTKVAESNGLDGISRSPLPKKVELVRIDDFRELTIKGVHKNQDFVFGFKEVDEARPKVEENVHSRQKTRPGESTSSSSVGRKREVKQEKNCVIN